MSRRRSARRHWPRRITPASWARSTAFQSLADADVFALQFDFRACAPRPTSRSAARSAQVNTLLKQINDLNAQAQQATIGGDTGSAVFDQRDRRSPSLSQLIGIRTQDQADGSVSVMTTDGVSLVGGTYAPALLYRRRDQRHLRPDHDARTSIRNTGDVDRQRRRSSTRISIPARSKA